jgi:Mn-dependent DtxR family transcriptional regulator
MSDTFDNLTTRILAMVIAGESSPTAIGDALHIDRLVVSRRLHALKDAGLVDWEPERRGTLRALVEVHPVGQWGQL